MYLDNAATTKCSVNQLHDLINEIDDKNLWYNPSSSYADNVRSEIEDVRRRIAESLDCLPEEITFNSGSSEGNCTVIQGFLKQTIHDGFHPVVITTALEHTSILKCVEDCVEDLHFVKIEKSGKIDLSSLENLLIYTQSKKNRVLVSIQFVSNELGVIQDIKEIASIVHRYDAILHTDATQAFGKFFISQKRYGFDFLTASGHKVKGLKGTGFLYKSRGIDIKPLIYGEQENGLRGGTQNTLGILSMRYFSPIINPDIVLRECFFVKELKRFGVKFTLNGFDELERIRGRLKENVSNIVSITFDEVNAESLILSLQTEDVFCSMGSACSAPSEKMSETLKAIGLDDSSIKKTIRFSFDSNFDFDVIENLVQLIKKHIDAIKAEGSI